MITEKEKIENLLPGGDFLKMFRLNFRGQRLYVSNEPVKVYSGLTGALDSATFKGNNENKRLDSWRKDFLSTFSKTEYDNYMNFTASFGTLVHESLFRIWKFGEINWEEEEDLARKTFEEDYIAAGLEPNFFVINNMIIEYKKHVASMLFWFHEKVEEVFAIETMCKDDNLEIATPVDVVCKMRERKNGEAKMTAVNIKTSGQITKKHLEQVAIERYIWNQTYPDFQCENAAIVRTKNWRKQPSYEVSISNADTEKIIKRLELCLADEESTYRPDTSYFDLTGTSKLGDEILLEKKTIEDML